MGKKNVILSFASTYSYYDIQTFVESWKENAGDVELYLFYLSFSEWTKMCLENMGVNLIEASEKYLEEFMYKHGNVMYIRMQLFNDFLKKHAHEFSSVMICDVRDAVIQDNPFYDVPESDYLNFSSEGIPIVKTNTNQEWITRILGDESWKMQFGTREVLNGGVYYGSVNGIINYQKVLIENAPNDKFWGADQASMNYVVYSGLLETKNISYSGPDSEDMVSVVYNQGGYGVRNGYIVNKKNKAPHVVHQYDRVLELAELVDSKYRKKAFVYKIKNMDTRSSLEMIKAYIYWGMYKEAIESSLLLDDSVKEFCSPELIMPIVDSILHQCNSLKEKSEMSIIWQSVWNYANNMFYVMSNGDKVSYIEMYLNWINETHLINLKQVDEFRNCIWELLKYNVKEEKWIDAYKLIETSGWRMKNFGSDFYIVYSEICRHLNFIDESIQSYTLACNIQCKPIYYLKTHFQSYVVYKNGYIICIHTEHVDDIIFEDMIDTHPLCIMKKEHGFIMFSFEKGQFMYIQSIQRDGSVVLGDSPKIFEGYLENNKVSIKAFDDEFLSPRSSGNFGFVKWSKTWEKFEMIPCNVTRLYSLMGR